MVTLFEIGLSNALVAAVLGLFLIVLGRVVRRPALLHALWLIVLLKLVTPPVVRFPVAELLLPQASTVPVAPEGFALPQFGGAPVEESTPIESEVLLERFDWQPESGEVWVPASTPAETVRVSLPEAASLPLYQLFAYVWILGSFLTFLLTAIRVVRFRRLLRFCRTTPAGLQREVEQLARQMGLRRPPRVCLMPGCVSPMVWLAGRQARLLFPEGLLERLAPQERATLVVHELAHLRRRDHWVRWFEMLLTGLYWWHPLVWWARRGIRDAEEQCCDAWVVWALPTARNDYAQALIQTIEFLSKARTTVPANATGVGQSQTLKRRLTMIMRGKTKRSISLAGLFGIVAVAALVLPTLPTWGQNDVEDSVQREPKQAAPKESAPKSGEESGAASVNSVDPFSEFGEPGKPSSPGGKTARREVEYLPRPSPIERRIAVALEEPTTLEFEEESLEDVLQYLQNLHEVPIFIDRNGLEAIDVFPSEETVTINLTGLTLRSGLRLLLDQLGLDYLIQNDVLMITSADKVKKTLITRIYPLGDLWTDPKDAEELVEAIQNTVSLDSWDPVGSGTIVPITKSHSLVIRQNYRIHEELVRFLRALRAARDLKEAAKNDHGELEFENQALNHFGKPMTDKPDGRIVYVSSRLGLVWVNQGSDDGISKGQRFAVYAKSDPGEQKAEIEVMVPRGSHLAEARILNFDAEKGVSLVEGDLIRTQEEE